MTASLTNRSLGGFVVVLTALNLMQLSSTPLFGSPAQAAKQDTPNAFDHITARRLDLVDDQGVPRVTIAAPLPNPQIGGVEYPRTAPAYGIMLRDAEGNEMGGIGTLNINGNRVALVAFDHPTAEAIGFNLINKQPGFSIMEAPPEEASIGKTGPLRVHIGLDESGAPSLILADGEGRTRLRMRVDSNGEPHIEFLNEKGDVTKSIGEK